MSTKVYWLDQVPRPEGTGSTARRLPTTLGSERCKSPRKAEPMGCRSGVDRVAVSADGLHRFAPASRVHLLQNSMDMIPHRKL